MSPDSLLFSQVESIFLYDEAIVDQWYVGDNQATADDDKQMISLSLHYHIVSHCVMLFTILISIIRTVC